MASCPEQIAQLQNIRELQSNLSHLIERVSDSQKITTQDKIDVLLKIYKVRKQMVEMIEDLRFDHFFDSAPGELEGADFDSVNEYLIRKTKKERNLNKRELSFIYELHKIDPARKSRSYFYDKKFEKLKALRDIKTDLSEVTGYLPEEISLNDSELTFGTTKFHYGSLIYKLEKKFYNLDFPEVVFGDLQLENATSISGIRLPRIIGGILSLNQLESLGDAVVLPEYVRTGIYLDRIKEIKDVWTPAGFNGNLSLNGLTSAEGLNLPRELHSLSLNELVSADGLVLPEAINWSLSLQRLKSAEGLKLPKNIPGKLDLWSLETVAGLELPESVGRDLILGQLKSIEGLQLPRNIGGSLDLRSIKSADGLVFPKVIHGYLFLTSLESTSGLVLPEVVDGTLNLDSIKSPKGLILPKESHGNIHLDGLKTAEGLVFPIGTEGISLNKLESIDGLELPEEIHFGISLDSLSTGLKMYLRKKYPYLKIE